MGSTRKSFTRDIAGALSNVYSALDAVEHSSEMQHRDFVYDRLSAAIMTLRSLKEFIELPRTEDD